MKFLDINDADFLMYIAFFTKFADIIHHQIEKRTKGLGDDLDFVYLDGFFFALSTQGRKNYFMISLERFCDRFPVFAEVANGESGDKSCRHEGADETSGCCQGKWFHMCAEKLSLIESE